MVSNIAFQDHILNATIELLLLDIVDDNRTPNQFDEFYNNDNLQDVMNTQLSVGNILQSSLRRGELFSNRLQLLTDVSARPFYDRFENQLAGWSLTFSIQLPNNNVSIC